MNIELQFTGGTSGAESMLSAIQDRERQYTEEELYKDLDWIEASGKLYEMNEGKKFDGDYKALAKYGIDQMSEFNYNISLGMIPDVMAVEKADHETQIAFAYLMDTYDKKDVTLAGVGRAFKELALDPTSYLGISTLGAGFAVKQGAKTAAKEGFKNRLHAGIRSYLSSGLAVGATEGALYTAGDTTARQSVMQDAGLMEGYDPSSIATSAGLGAVAGAGIVKGAEVIGKQIGKGIDYLNKQGEEAMAQVAGGGTPPKVEGMPDTDPLVRMIMPKGEFEGVGAENGTVKKDGISLLKSEYGSNRYVYTKDGEIISALQVMSKDGKNGEIANVYTTPLHRRTGIARELYNEAKKDFKSLKHSRDLTEQGKLFKEGVDK